MPGSFKFFKDSARTDEDTSSDFSEAKVMVYEDGGENKYILDASGITGIDNIDELKLSNLKDIKIKYQPKDSSNAEKVEGLGNIIGKLFATKSTSDSKTILEKEVARKPVAEAILGATDSDGKKSILVEKLGEFLNEQTATHAVYGNSRNETASDFLADKYPLAKIDASNLDADNKKAFAEAILGATESTEKGQKSIL